jgi:hypothetical protein
MHLDLSAWDHYASRCIWIDHIQETSLISLHKILIIYTPCFSLQKSCLLSIIQISRFNTINQASVLPHFSLIFIILSRIELILPIQSRGRKINRSYLIIFNSSSFYQPAQHRLLTLSLCNRSVGLDLADIVDITISSSIQRYVIGRDCLYIVSNRQLDRLYQA